MTMTKLPKRRNATTKEILRYMDERIVRKRGQAIPAYFLVGKFHMDTKLKASPKRFYRVIEKYGYINRSSLRSGFVEGVAYKHGD